MNIDTGRSSVAQLKDITRVILSEPLDYLELKNADDLLKGLFVDTLGLAMDSEGYHKNITLASGKAINESGLPVKWTDSSFSLAI